MRRHRLRKKASRSTNSPAEAVANDWVRLFGPHNNLDRWAKMEPKRKIVLDDTFSLHHDPGEVLTRLARVLYDARCNKHYFPTLHYGGKVCFGALYLLDSLSWGIARHRKWKVNWGNMPPDEVEKFSKLRSVETTAYTSEPACMVNEVVYINRHARASAQTYRAESKKLRDRLAQVIAEARGTAFRLPLEATQPIDTVIGELFDNVLQHVPDAQYGSLCCFYDKRQQELTILIFNFGLTIADSLMRANIPAGMRDHLGSVIESHTRQGLYNWLRDRPAFTRENALILLALQEGISSKISNDPSRGQRLPNFIESCCELTPGCRFSVISGRTAILIDDRYPMQPRDLWGRTRQVLALNKENDLTVKSAASHVRQLNTYFPGVIIETTIPLSF